MKSDNINFDFTWYSIFTLEDLRNLDVPDYKTEFLINREALRVFKVQSYNVNSEAIKMLTINYKREFITLEDDDDVVESTLYSIMLFNEVFYFGILK